MAQRTFAIVCTLQWEVGSHGCTETKTWYGTTTTDKTSRADLTHTVVEHAAQELGASARCATLFLSIEPDEL
jgi:hypothetical protein